MAGHCGNDVDITLPGGTLRVQWDGKGEVMMEGPATEVFTGEWASDDYREDQTADVREWRALPETNQQCEVVDGVLVMPPSPFGEHPWAIRVIFGALDRLLESNDLGIALTAPYDVLIHRDPLRVRQPDILVVNAELTGIARPSDLSGLPFLELPPLLVVEVLSPSNTPRDVRKVGRLPGHWRSGVLAGKLR